MSFYNVQKHMYKVLASITIAVKLSEREYLGHINGILACSQYFRHIKSNNGELMLPIRRFISSLEIDNIWHSVRGQMRPSERGEGGALTYSHPHNLSRARLTGHPGSRRAC